MRHLVVVINSSVTAAVHTSASMRNRNRNDRTTTNLTIEIENTVKTDALAGGLALDRPFRFQWLMEEI